MKIRYWGDANVGTGFHVAALGYVKALQELGYGPDKLRFVAAHANDVREITSDHELWPFIRSSVDTEDCEVNIVHTSPPNLAKFHTARAGRYNIAITAWETDRLPQHLTVNAYDRQMTVLESLELFDEVWVPSDSNAAVFIESGLPADKVHVIPHYIDQVFFAPTSINVPELHPAFSQEGDALRFYYIGTWNARKNVEALIRAYLNTGWTLTTPVELAIHIGPAPEQLYVEHAAFVQQRMKDLIAATHRDGELPVLTLHTKRQSAIWVKKFHELGHCFISATCGEAFCLPAHEALYANNWVAMGGPISDELYQRNDRAVFPVEHDLIPIELMPEAPGYEMEQKWWQPKLDDLTQAFKDVFTVAKRGDARNWGKSCQDTVNHEVMQSVGQRIKDIEAEIGGRESW